MTKYKKVLKDKKRYSYERKDGTKVTVPPHNQHYNIRIYRNISSDRARKEFEKRSKRSRAIDKARKSKNLKEVPDEEWSEDPARSDIIGIDTPDFKTLNLDISKFNEEYFKILENAKGEIDTLSNKEFSKILPHTWNHYKKQYVAEIEAPSLKYDGLERDFISSRENFSSSGKNADLTFPDINNVSYPEGTLIEFKIGSHKNMIKQIYRRDKDGWRRIAKRETYGGYYGGKNKEKWKLFNAQIEDNFFEHRNPQELKIFIESSPNPIHRKEAIKNLNDTEYLKDLAKTDETFEIRNLAYKRLEKVSQDAYDEVKAYYKKTYYS